MAHKWAGWLHNACPLAPGGPSASEQREELEVARKWAGWLHNPCRLMCPHCLMRGGRITSGPASGPGGYITLAA